MSARIQRAGIVDQIRIVLSYSDNKGVKSLYGKVDDGEYEEINGVITGGGTTLTKDYACVEDGTPIPSRQWMQQEMKR